MARYSYSRLPSPLGPVHTLATDAGLAALYFDPQEPDMERRFPAVERARNGRQKWLVRTEAFLACYFAGDVGFSPEIPLDLRGTAFQKDVWEALLAVEAGATKTYGEIARQLGRPEASRAVGAAVGRNPVSLIVPCHRIVGSTGKLTGYAGGVERKRFLLELEGSAAGGESLLFES